MSALKPGERWIEFECPRCHVDFDIFPDENIKLGDTYRCCNCDSHHVITRENSNLHRVDDAGVIRYNEDWPA